MPDLGMDDGTKKMASGIVFAALGGILILAVFGLAGPAGGVISRVGGWFLGWGYVFLPVAFWFLAAIFFFSGRKYSPSVILGVFLVLVSLLGISDALGKDAGVLGAAVSSPIYIFGFWATLVIMAALGLIGLLLAFSVGVREEKEKELILESVPRELLPPPPPTTAPVQTTREVQPVKKESEIEIAPTKSGSERWQFPPATIFDNDSSRPQAGDIRTNAKIIQRTLHNFGIPVEMGEVHVGPTVTRYTLKPAQGIKLSRIVALQNDLALALAAHPLRIEAPIPGQALVGIEVPNHSAARVRLGGLVGLAPFKDARSPLVFPLGRDVMGEAVFADLARMPHLLVAGATGSGKSIFIHGLLLSLIFKNQPRVLRLILIDPKRVELSQYRDIPYLLTPVITEGKRSVQALRWAIGEMERRYDVLLEAKSRDILSYNEKLPPDAEGRLPFIVIVIDELADLMAAYGREIEGSIVKLAQMARATGIHLVVSTQRPSVEVITGLIKANITSRVAFQVASQVDSRTILDTAGAEKLLGSGDMLFLAPESSKPRRIQAPLVSEAEVKRLAEYVRKAADRQGMEEEIQPISEELFAPQETTLADEALEYEDALYPDAYRVVVEAKKASASLLQRRLKIGYARAARLLDIMEAKGLIGPADGAKPREVFVDKDRGKYD